jgi:DNA-directed RNA polymerase subunit RPC12/RpoP
MIKYVCVKCGKVWYTANTSSDQKCDDCGGLLEDSEVCEKQKK